MVVELPELLGSPERHKGRDIRAAYQRGWGLQFGDLVQQIRMDPLYRQALAAAGDRSIVSEVNRMNLFLLLNLFLPKLPSGHIVEFGTYRGGSALFMARICAEIMPDTKVYGFDSFAGMPETDSSRDAHREGDFSDANYEAILERCNSLGLGRNLVLVKGLFEDTAPKKIPEIGAIRLNHIDCDIYSSVKLSYDCSLKYMVEGGYWVYDDALYSSCIGAMEAVEELTVQRDGRHAEQVYPHLVYRNWDRRD